MKIIINQNVKLNKFNTLYSIQKLMKLVNYLALFNFKKKVYYNWYTLKKICSPKYFKS